MILSRLAEWKGQHRFGFSSRRDTHFRESLQFLVRDHYRTIHLSDIELDDDMLFEDEPLPEPGYVEDEKPEPEYDPDEFDDLLCEDAAPEEEESEAKSEAEE